MLSCGQGGGDTRHVVGPNADALIIAACMAKVSLKGVGTGGVAASVT